MPVLMHLMGLRFMPTKCLARIHFYSYTRNNQFIKTDQNRCNFGFLKMNVISFIGEQERMLLVSNIAQSYLSNLEHSQESLKAKVSRQALP